MRLDHIAEEFGDAVVIEWRAYLLRPMAEPRPLDRFRRYTESWLRPAAEEPEAELRPWASDDPAPTHSVPPAVAAKAAATFGPDAFRRYHRALMRAYFAEHRTISDRRVLVEVAGECGLDAAAFDTVLTERGAALQADAFAEWHAALDEGIYAAPTVVVNGEHPLTGALPTDAYRRVIRRLTAREATRDGPTP